MWIILEFIFVVSRHKLVLFGRINEDLIANKDVGLFCFFSVCSSAEFLQEVDWILIFSLMVSKDVSFHKFPQLKVGTQCGTTIMRCPANQTEERHQTSFKLQYKRLVEKYSWASIKESQMESHNWPNKIELGFFFFFFLREIMERCPSYNPC